MASFRAPVRPADEIEEEISLWYVEIEVETEGPAPTIYFIELVVWQVTTRTWIALPETPAGEFVDLLEDEETVTGAFWATWAFDESQQLLSYWYDAVSTE